MAGGVATFATVGATVATVPASAGCKACTTMACGSTLTFTDIALSSARPLNNGRLTLCRGEQCSSSVLRLGLDRVVKAPDYDASNVPYLGCGGMGFSCFGYIDAANGSVSLSVEIVEAAEGTPLSVTVATPDGTVVATHDGVAAYHSTEPNGPGCSPTCSEGRF
jgi:hypothetical protein